MQADRSLAVARFRCGGYDVALIYYLDAGNSRLKVWVCDAVGSVLQEAAVKHHGTMVDAVTQLASDIKGKPSAVLGTSVLGADAEVALAQAIQREWGCRPVFARTQYQQCGIRNAYGEQYAMLGVDRWLALLGYGDIPSGASCACIVDCGTAITVDILGESGAHEGGYILPGLQLMASSLLRHTSRVRFDESCQDGILPGRNTAEAVTHGAMMAVVALIERLSVEKSADLVLTGGDALRVAGFLAVPHRHDPLLLLKGLQRYFAEAGIS